MIAALPTRSELLRIKDDDGQNGVLARLKTVATEHPEATAELVALGRVVGLSTERLTELNALMPKYGDAGAGGAHGQRRLDGGTVMGIRMRHMAGTDAVAKPELPAKSEIVERAEVDEQRLDDAYGIGMDAFRARHVLDRLGRDGPGKLSLYVDQLGTREGDRIQRALMWLSDVDDAFDLSRIDDDPRAMGSGVAAGDSPQNDAAYLQAIAGAKSASHPRFKAVFEYGGEKPTVTIWSLPQPRRTDA